MKLLVIFLFNICLSFTALSQIPFPDIYCNKQKVMYYKINSFYTPSEFEFRFPGKDTTYLIKEGSIEIKNYKKTTPINFKGNKFRNNEILNCSSAKIIIKKTEIRINNQLVKIDTTQVSRLVLLSRASVMNKSEASVINSNDGIVALNNRLVNPSIIQENPEEIEVSYKDKNIKILEFEVSIVRNRWSMHTITITGTKGKLDDEILESIKPGDFILIKVKDENGYLFNKVILIR